MDLLTLTDWTLRALPRTDVLATVRECDGPDLDQPTPALPESIAAQVPGCVHTDLLAAGLISDPYDGATEHDLHWIGLTPWEYSTTIVVDELQADERAELVFHGVDTVARIELGGQLLGEVENQHRTYVFDISAFAGRGELPLVVTFSAQTLEAYDRAETQQHRTHVNHHPYNSVRKMACNFGWDWGPDLVTAGLWRPVELRRWRTARLDEPTMLPGLDGETGTIAITTPVVVAGNTPLQVRVECAGADVTLDVVDGVAHGELRVPGVEPWWPAGHGEQPLYEIMVRLLHGDEVLDEQTRRTGFRTVTLDTSEDGHGRRFAIAVNGREIFIKGANWIPDDCFPARITREQYRAAVTDAVDGNMNLLRVWGGGIYESTDFYEACDELGILVWQDVLMACAAYDEESLGEQIVAEIRDNLPRLAAHPSLAVWNGNNENLWGAVDWHWAETADGRSWGYGLYTDVFPRLFAELDPTRPYSPGSPWSFDESRHPNDDAYGSMHIWDGWNYADQGVYTRYRPRFVSEFGYQGPPGWSTLVGSVHDEPTTPTSPQMLVHQKAVDGDDKLTYGIAAHLPLPTDFEDWHWATQLQQARAVRYAIEHFRALQPHCMGSIVWQLNDCWPVTSWAAVDSTGIRKPLWYGLQQAYAPRMATIQSRDGNPALVCSNDTDDEWLVEGTAASYLVPAITGETKTFEPLRVPPRSVAYRVLGNARPGHVLDVALGDRHVIHLPVEPRDLALTEDHDTVVEQVDGGYAVTVSARTLVLDLTLLVDKLDPAACVDSGLVTLAPGTSHTFRVTTGATLDPADLVSARVLRSANQLVAAARATSKENA